MDNRSSSQTIDQIHQVLQRLIGLHRQLLDTVRVEREALVNADIKGIQETTYAKEALIQAIHQQEAERMKATALLVGAWKKPLKELTLQNIIIGVQGYDQKMAEQLRSSYNALTIMIQRITEQNRDNATFVERSLEHIRNMKSNVLRESVPHSNTYTAKGQKVASNSGARLLSKEI